MEKVRPFKPMSIQKLTPAQERIWSVLQNEENRTLSVKEICQRAGYRSSKPWYDAMRDAHFRMNVTALGIIVIQHEKNGYGTVLLAENPDEEWQKDRVDLRRLTAEYPKHVEGSHFKLDFSFIQNPVLKSVVKRYFRARVGFWEAGTFKSRLWDMKPFFIAFGTVYPEAESFVTLTREMIEPFLKLSTWYDVRGHVRIISQSKRFHMLGSLSTMFLYMQRHQWLAAPSCILIYDEDYPKRIRRRPRPLPQNVFDQLVTHAHLLPPHAQNLVTILSVAGLRAEDAMHLSEDCLEHDAAGDPRLHWYNHKMKREGRPLPITTAVAEAIQRQRDVVRGIPDLFGKRYLFRTARGLYQFALFSHHLDRLAEQLPILDENGQIYHSTPHQLRHSVGTQMINNGMGIADVMTYLDHMSPEMTLRYAEIADDTLKQKFKALVLSGHMVGGAALKTLKEQLGKGDESELDWVVSNLRKLSLPWGQCLHHAKANKCPYGQNACFTKDNGPCHKLVTTPEHAPVIIATMEDLKRSKQIAGEQGWEMYANDLTDQINGMEQVLTELQFPSEQRSKNRGGVK